jgi:hypothetical protein
MKQGVGIMTILSKETISLLVALVNNNRTRGHGKFYDDIQALADCLHSDGVLEQIGFYDYAFCADEEPQVPVVPVGPDVWAISPATINLLVAAINANSYCSLSRDCEALRDLQNSAVADGLIKRTDLYTCESCVDEPVEAPVVPVIPFVTKEV